MPKATHAYLLDGTVLYYLCPAHVVGVYTGQDEYGVECETVPADTITAHPGQCDVCRALSEHREMRRQLGLGNPAESPDDPPWEPYAKTDRLTASTVSPPVTAVPPAPDHRIARVREWIDPDLGLVSPNTGEVCWEGPGHGLHLITPALSFTIGTGRRAPATEHEARRQTAARFRNPLHELTWIVPCPTCNGTREVEVDFTPRTTESPAAPITAPCGTCDGAGVIEEANRG